MISTLKRLKSLIEPVHLYGHDNSAPRNGRTRIKFQDCVIVLKKQIYFSYTSDKRFTTSEFPIAGIGLLMWRIQNTPSDLQIVYSKYPDNNVFPFKGNILLLEAGCTVHRVHRLFRNCSKLCALCLGYRSQTSAYV